MRPSGGASRLQHRSKNLRIEERRCGGCASAAWTLVVEEEESCEFHPASCYEAIQRPQDPNLCCSRRWRLPRLLLCQTHSLASRVSSPSFFFKFLTPISSSHPLPSGALATFPPALTKSPANQFLSQLQPSASAFSSSSQPSLLTTPKSAPVIPSPSTSSKSSTATRHS